MQEVYWGHMYCKAANSQPTLGDNLSVHCTVHPKHKVKTETCSHMHACMHARMHAQSFYGSFGFRPGLPG